MKRRLLFDEKKLFITLRRLCAQLIERHRNFEHTLLIGLQPRGVFLANRLATCLQTLGHNLSTVGELDATLHRDDFQRTDKLHLAYPTRINRSLENKNVVLIDDVLYTGRTVRAAMDALLAYGRPKRIELLILIDRVHSRDMPIEANYIGHRVSALRNQRVHIELREQCHKKDGIWLSHTNTTTA